MSSEEIIPLTKQRIPTIVGFDPEAQSYTIGEEARRIGLKGKTTVFNFKPAFGHGDKEFAGLKKYWYWLPATSEHPQRTETFTAKEAGQRFLEALFGGAQTAERLIIGEPAIRDQTWKENFRRHMREIFSAMGLAEPVFFPEPFAVFQYYRHVDKTLPIASEPEIVLIIDMGGGTFNSCIIRTTEQGLLARGGATALPLGLQAGPYGGSEIDKELLKRIVAKCQSAGIRWKDDPVRRAEMTGSPALLRIEDAKIRLSDEISKRSDARLSEDFSSISVSISFPAGDLHPEREICQDLTGEDLKSVIREMWRRHYGQILCDTVNEARQKLQAVQLPLDRIDRVLVAGGSSRLPFVKEEIQTVLPNLVDKSRVYIGSDTGEAVAFGIACECREQAKRDPRLTVDKISPCILNDLYLGFKQTRRGPFEAPRVRKNGVLLPDAQLLSGPFETEELTQTYEIELPFNVQDRLFYYFSPTPFHDDPPSLPLNLTHDVFSVPPLTRISKRCELTLDIKPDGMIKPSFSFRGKGSQLSKKGEVVRCPEFYFEGFQIREGKTYVGLDFGNSNSYLVRFVSFSKEITGAQYPEFTLRPKVKAQLRELELRLQEFRQRDLLETPKLMKHAEDQMLEVVFHSNKIEGNPLTKGETADVLAGDVHTAMSAQQREAKNLETSYRWMLENIDSCQASPEAFIRHINEIITRGVASHGGEYRKGPVKLSGMDFTPPAAGSVPAFMHQLANEIRTGAAGRSGLECAVSFHTKLVWIHPFNDGNGRTARLLLNAYLLSQALPVIVVNYADRERYLHCLSESNKGDLSSLVEFMIDCFEQQLAEFVTPSAPAPEEVPEPVPIPPPQPVEIDPIVSVLEQAGVGEADDPLTAIMKMKVVERQKTIEAEYEAWKQSVLTIPAELRAVVESFNANELYDKAGYHMRCRVYDLLTLERYIDIARGKNIPRTWFVGLEIFGPTSRERVMWFFTGASWVLKQDTRVSGVSIVVSRFDGTRYTRLSSEPINLREIGYRQGALLFVSRERKTEEGSARKILQTFLAETIKAYL